MLRSDVVVIPVRQSLTHQSYYNFDFLCVVMYYVWSKFGYTKLLTNEIWLLIVVPIGQDMASPGFRYNALFLDEDRQHRMKILESKPWSLVNLLPLEVTISRLRSIGPNAGRLVKVITIKPFGKGETMDLVEGDQVHVSILSKGRYFQLTDPITLIGDTRVIKIGDVVYKETTNTLVQRSHSDIMGLRIHNHLPMRIDVYWTPGDKNASLRKGGGQPLLLAHIGGSNGTDSTTGMSGAISSSFIMNDRFGFNIGDMLSFIFSDSVSAGPNGPGVKVMISDNYMSEVHVGMVTQSFNPAIRDMFSYRINTPNILGSPYIVDAPGSHTPMTGPSTRPGELEYVTY